MPDLSERLKSLAAKASGALRASASDADPTVSNEAIIWAIRMMLGREPRNAKEIEQFHQYTDVDNLRRALAETPEFQSFLSSLKPWAAPLFLLEPPTNRAIPAVFRPPSLAAPTSQLCTEAQFHDELHSKICQALAIPSNHLHRKTWEFVWIVAVLHKAGLLRAGQRGLGFGVGNEPLPAFFARVGIEVLASDAPSEVIDGHGWETTGQHAAGREQLFRPNILDRETFDKRVSFAPVDMNDIPENFTGFDFCWSACCFEHLGSIEKGLDFVRNSLKTLKLGGLALHTTEFNLTSNDDTFEHPTLSLFRKRDIESLYARLIEEGHKPWPLNFFPGLGQVDAYVDLPPFTLPHLKLQLDKYVSTSIGLVVQKGGA